MVNVAHTIASASSKLLVRPEIRRPEDLRGKKIATSSIRLAGRFSVSLRAAQVWPEPRPRNHMALDRHQRRTAAGVVHRRHRRRRRSLSGRRSSRAQRLPGFDRRPKRNYLPDDIDRDTAQKPFKTTATRSMRFVRSHVEGIAFHKQNKEFSSQSVDQIRQEPPTRSFWKAPTIYSNKTSSPRPIRLPKALKPTFDYVAQTRPEIRNRKPEEFVDASFISELDKSGFIKKLYEQK